MSSTRTPATLKDQKATETRPLALTTQFSPPKDNDCNIRDLIEATPGDDVFEKYKKSSDLWYITSDTKDPRFAECQPSGWADRPSAQRFYFSPAVCPSGWVWSSIEVVNKDKPDEYTTARCCDQGFTFVRQQDDDSPSNSGRCMSRFGIFDPPRTVHATLLHGQGEASWLTRGTVVHEAWQIAWHASDQDRLQPAPPTLTGKTTGLPSWDGDEDSIDDRDYLTTGLSSSQSGLRDRSFIAAYVVPPIAVVALVAGVVACLVHGKKKERRKNAGEHRQGG